MVGSQFYTLITPTLEKLNTALSLTKVRKAGGQSEILTEIILSILQWCCVEILVMEQLNLKHKTRTIKLLVKVEVMLSTDLKGVHLYKTNPVVMAWVSNYVSCLSTCYILYNSCNKGICSLRYMPSKKATEFHSLTVAQRIIVPLNANGPIYWMLISFLY